MEFKGRRTLLSDEAAEALEELRKAGLNVHAAGLPLEDRPGRPHPYSHGFSEHPPLELSRKETVELFKRGELEVDVKPGDYEILCGGLPVAVGRVGRDGVLRVRLPRKYRRLNLW